MEELTFEEYRTKKVEFEEAMHQSKVEEKKAMQDINLHYEDLLKDCEIDFRKKRNAIREEREAKKLEVSKMFKDKRRDIYTQECKLIIQWKSQMTYQEGGEHE